MSVGHFPPISERRSPLHYPNVTSAVFLSRPNRFVAQVEQKGRQEPEES